MKEYDLSPLQSAHIGMVRIRIGESIKQARRHEDQAAALWRSTLTLLGQEIGAELPPDTRIQELEGGGIRLAVEENGTEEPGE